MPSDHINELLGRHTLHKFDDELNNLHSRIVQMAGLVLYQLRQALQALNDKNVENAEMVVVRDCDVDGYEISIDHQVAIVLGKESPVARDLRIVLATSKIGFELEKIGNEIADFGRLVANLFNPETSNPNPYLLRDLVKIGNLIEVMLSKLMDSIKNMDASEAKTLLQYVHKCENEYQDGIKHQLALVVQDARMMGRTVDIMKMMIILDTCGGHCRDIVKYIIYMVESSNVNRESRAVQ